MVRRVARGSVDLWRDDAALDARHRWKFDEDTCAAVAADSGTATAVNGALQDVTATDARMGTHKGSVFLGASAGLGVNQYGAARASNPEAGIHWGAITPTTTVTV